MKAYVSPGRFITAGMFLAHCDAGLEFKGMNEYGYHWTGTKEQWSRFWNIVAHFVL